MSASETALPLTYAYPGSPQTTFRLGAAVVILGAIAFASIPGETIGTKVFLCGSLALGGLGLLKCAHFYRAFAVIIENDAVRYGAPPNLSFRLSDVATVDVRRIRGGKVLMIREKSGKCHALPGDLQDLFSLAHEIASRSHKIVNSYK